MEGVDPTKLDPIQARGLRKAVRRSGEVLVVVGDFDGTSIATFMNVYRYYDCRY